MKKKFEYYTDIFLKTCYIKNKKSTYSTYKYTINKHILPYFKDYTPNNIDIGLIIQFIDKLSSNGLKNKSIKDMLIILNEILKLANVNIDIPYPKVIKKEIVTLSIKEQFLLEKELLNDITPIKLGIYLSLYTGLRIGELCALNINNIDFKNNRIYIKNTLTRVSNINSKKKLLSY